MGVAAQGARFPPTRERRLANNPLHHGKHPINIDHAQEQQRQRHQSHNSNEAAHSKAAAPAHFLYWGEE